MLKLALQNFKSSFRNYIALVISLAFTILVLLNFQYIIYSDAFTTLGERNKQYIDMVVQIISIVLGCFMFFFIWYATNVFLTKRKKEIGIYVFMGLTNQKIGRLYMLESIFTGLTALVLGIGVGTLVTHLFQLILVAISDVTVNIQFHFEPKPIIGTAVIYLVLYLVFVIKGYVSIVRSSVLDMVSAGKKNEYVKRKNWLLVLKAILGMCVLAGGYFLAVKNAGQEALNNATMAVVLVIVGVYLLFGGMIPFVFQRLEKSKKFLYQKQRTLWINQVIFRMKKNYRTYAMTCVLMICSVTALAAAFAMKMRYDKMVHFRNTYTFQVLANEPDLDDTLAETIGKDNEITYSGEITMLALDSSKIDTKYQQANYALLSYSQLKTLAEHAGLEFDLPEPSDQEVINLQNQPLISTITEQQLGTVNIGGKEFQEIADSKIPYMGYLQEDIRNYVVSDKSYEEMIPQGQQIYTYNYRIKDIYNYEASLDDLDALVNGAKDVYVGRVAVNPKDTELEWVKVMYSVCIFVFMVFILASGSILYMKLYNDAFEEKERYRVLKKLGIGKRTLAKSIARELFSAYALPFVVMAVSSYFSVEALAKVTRTDLLAVNLISVGVIFVFLVLCYLGSVVVYKKNVELRK
ncbi:MAG: ABC transporter permease [Lachnospiraceae bacterium]|nr:ABC transporter permease [Lachnospiraceae bacterium]